MPLVPSIEITSPSYTVRAPTVNKFARSSTEMLSVPQIAVLPIPRATTAACEVFPPRLVRIPSEATIPTKSSGLVSRRTRITLWPARAKSNARRESKTTSPTAAPAEAGIPRAISVTWPERSNCGNIRWPSCSPEMRESASSIEILPSSTSCRATRKAASAVRLPTRVCKIQSFPRSTVNSISHRSR